LSSSSSVSLSQSPSLLPQIIPEKTGLTDLSLLDDEVDQMKNLANEKEEKEEPEFEKKKRKRVINDIEIEDQIEKSEEREDVNQINAIEEKKDVDSIGEIKHESKDKSNDNDENCFEEFRRNTRGISKIVTNNMNIEKGDKIKNSLTNKKRRVLAIDEEICEEEEEINEEKETEEMKAQNMRRMEVEKMLADLCGDEDGDMMEEKSGVNEEDIENAEGEGSKDDAVGHGALQCWEWMEEYDEIQVFFLLKNCRDIFHFLCLILWQEPDLVLRRTCFFHALGGDIQAQLDPGGHIAGRRYGKIDLTSGIINGDKTIENERTYTLKRSLRVISLIMHKIGEK
jgi:hypothetical protein